MKKLSTFALSFFAALAFAGCNDSINGDIEENNPDNYDRIALEFSSHSLAIMQANDCNDYRKHVLDALARNIADQRFLTTHYYGVMPPIYDNAEDLFNAYPGGVADSDASKPGEFTVTNVQESGVDELDTVKNDGNYMYAIRNNDIHITKIWPAEDTKEIAVIKNNTDNNSNSYYSQAGIFLTGNKLIEIGTAYSWKLNEGGWYNNYRNVVRVRIYDVSNPAAPALITTHQYTGYLEDARLVNGRVVLVSSASPINNWYTISELADADIPGVPKLDTEKFEKMDWEEIDEIVEKWISKGDENVKKYLPVIRAWLDKKYPNIDTLNWPQYSDGKTNRNLFNCSDLYIPSTTSKEEGFLIVSELSGDNFDKSESKAITDYGWTVYASTKNLYIVSNSYNWWWRCEDASVNAPDGSVSSNDTSNCRPYSHIHHFSLGNDDSKLKYVNSAEFNGTINDSFWMSEYKDHLRVVSSPYAWGNSPDGFTLSVFDINTPKQMKLTGSVSGFGKDERLYAARMFGDKGYVVTFRNTDPLFTFDLSDPSAPKQMGELKINGYSSYIHPVGQNHLLTIGEDADDNGRITGMQLQLFDVSNLADPKQKYKVIVAEEHWDEYSSTSAWSEALYNHHAINYHEASGLLAIPVNISSWKYTNHYSSWNYHNFSGAFIYRVTPDTDFEFVGGIDHQDLISEKSEYYWWTSVDRARFYFKDAGVYDKNAYVYTLSNHGIKVNDANKPDTTIASVKYEK